MINYHVIPIFKDPIGCIRNSFLSELIWFIIKQWKKVKISTTRNGIFI